MSIYLLKQYLMAAIHGIQKVFLKYFVLQKAYDTV